jgi:hypothetical protein
MSEFFYKAAGAMLAPFRYAEREVDHFKEMAKEDIQALVANIIKYTILGIAGLLFLLFISIMTAALINRNMESEFAGYAFVAGFYLLVAIIVFISKQASDHKRKEENNSQKTVGA